MNKSKKAISLKYDSGTAPRILNKGEGVVAEEILALARELNLPIYENESLVDQLMKLDYMQEIPEDLYELVAIILSFAYEALGKNPSPE
jgi:flagellar biosynthesis protein